RLTVPGDRAVPATPAAPASSATLSASAVRPHPAGYPRRRVLAHAGAAVMSAIFMAVPVSVPWSFAAMFRRAEPPDALALDGETQGQAQALDAALPAASAPVETDAPPAVIPTAKPPVPAIAEARHKVASHPQRRVHKTPHREARFPWWDRFMVSR